MNAETQTDMNRVFFRTALYPLYLAGIMDQNSSAGLAMIASNVVRAGVEAVAVYDNSTCASSIHGISLAAEPSPEQTAQNES